MLVPLEFAFGETERTGRLRQPTPADTERIAAICQDASIQRFTRVPSPYTREDAEEYIAMVNDRWSSGLLSSLIVDVHGRLVASIGFVDSDDMDGWAEVGYWTAPEARRQGITTAALRRLARWAFEDRGLARLELQTAAGNAGSAAVAAGAGFVREGLRRSAAVLRAVEGMPRTRVDMTIWGRLRTEPISGRTGLADFPHG